MMHSSSEIKKNLNQSGKQDFQLLLEMESEVNDDHMLNEGISFMTEISEIGAQKKSQNNNSFAKIMSLNKRLRQPKKLIKSIPQFVIVQCCKYYGIKISLQSSEFTTFPKDVCLVPFKQTSLTCYPGYVIQPYLQYDVSEALKYFEEKQQLGDGALISLPSMGLHVFKELFFLKSSSKKYLKCYSTDLLQTCIKKVLHKMLLHDYQSISIPRIEWDGLSHRQTAGILIRTIFSFARENGYGKLKDISIFVSEKEVFREYSIVIRDIFDDYVRVQ